MTTTLDWLRGCATALVTPFKAGGAVDEKNMKALVERQIAGGVRLLVPCGTTGERATMDDAEGRRVIELTVQTAKGRAKIIAGAGSNNTGHAIHQAKEAAAVGADAVLIVAPYYNKPTQDGMLAHFRAVAEAVAPLPVVLYNVPGRTSSTIEAATTLKLAREVPNIVAIKEASGNFGLIMTILKDRPAGFRVFSGDDAVTLPLIALGADGIISVVSNEVPDLMARMTDLALAGKWDEARALHYKLLPLMDANFIESSPGPVKAAMAMMGLLEEQFRLPLVPVRETTRQKMKDTLAALGTLDGSKAHAAA
jgi:4-hydroxy-tetrahydrodipicolinate synthase